jgi:hypothetical protein
VIAIDLGGATNIAGDAAANGLDPQLEATNAAGVKPVAKTLWLDLNKFGYSHDKPEGIGLFPNGDLAVQHDNDFGFAQANDPQTAAAGDPPFKVTASGKTTGLLRFKATNLAGAPVGGAVPATLSLTLGAPAALATGGRVLEVRLDGTGFQRPGDGHVQAARRRDRCAAHGHLRQDADVHAVDDDALMLGAR